MATTIAITKDNISSLAYSQQEATARFLAAVPVFASLRETEIDELAASGWSHRSTRGQIIYCEGDVLRHLYIIESGSIKLICNSDEGKELIVGLAGPGDCFGNMAHTQPTGCFSQALEDSVLFMIPRQSLRRVAIGNPAFALDLLEMTERRSVAAQATAARLAFDTVPHRLSQLLLRISDTQYGILRFPVNQTEIANLIGSSRETVCSILSRLRRKGLISIVKGRIRILDRDGLGTVR
jgi:CRP/FNR family transcriptional regulator